MTLSINRREGLGLITAASLAASTPSALAQRQPQEGQHYKRLPRRLPGTPGKIDVLEFFWYGCPHCYAFEPVLEAWVKQLPPLIAFRPVHVFFGERTRNHQRLFYTLQAMGVEGQMRMPVFNAIHQQGNMLDTPEAMIKLLQPLGLDVAKFNSTWKAFEPQSFSAARIVAANKLTEAYGLDGVPAIGIGGQYLTSPGMASRGERLPESESGRRALLVTEMLLKTLSPS